MKIAFLFLTIDNHNQGVIWEKFFQEQYQDFYSIYSHPKFPDLVTQTFLKDNIIPETLQTAHADISVVRATLLLLKYALHDEKNEYFILLSESCVPLYNFQHIYHTVKLNSKSWIPYYHDIKDKENFSRWKQLKDSEFISFEKFSKQHTWILLHRDLVEILLKQDNYTPIFENVYCPDEHYFINLLMKINFPLKEKVINQMVTFVNWQDYEVETGIREHPEKGKYRYRKIRPKTYHHLSVQDVLNAQDQGCLFFRKVSPECNCQSINEAAVYEVEYL